MHIIKFRILGLIAAGAPFGMLPSAGAATLMSNFPGSNDGGLSTAIASITGDFTKAAGFTLGAGQDYILDSVVFRLEVNDESASLSSFDLFGDVGGDPGGAPLVNFSIPTLSAGDDDYTFLPTSAFTLMADTTYWIAATGSSPTPDGIKWLSSDPGIPPSGLATSAGYRFASNGTYPPTAISRISNTYQVNGTIANVPDTGATLALFGLSLGVLAGLRRFQSK